jgi:pyruvate/2-oxoglutarate dehydrogenase complex dihydrolipoamide acyltransferase (E2) component
MLPSAAPGKWDHAFFNMSSELIKEFNGRDFLVFITEVDVAGMDALRAQARAEGKVSPTYYAFVIKAAAAALREYPQLNVAIREIPFLRRAVRLPDITATIGVERDVDGSSLVFAPQLHDTDQMTAEEITLQLQRFAQDDIATMRHFREAMAMVRICRWVPGLVGLIMRIIRSSPRLWRKYRGGSYSVTSPGKYGGCDFLIPPWAWPVSFAFGTVKSRPTVVNGEVQARKIMRLTTAVDRRLTPGAPLARFTERIRQLLENPRLLSGEKPFVATKTASVAAAKPQPVLEETPA